MFALCMLAYVHLGHNSYIYAWISKLFDTVIVLGEENGHLIHCLGRLKVKVTLEGHINELLWAISPTYRISGSWVFQLPKCVTDRQTGRLTDGRE